MEKLGFFQLLIIQIYLHGKFIYTVFAKPNNVVTSSQSFISSIRSIGMDLFSRHAFLRSI